MPHTYPYPRPALTVDTVVFALEDEVLKVLLIQRAHGPYKACWAFPGGFVDLGECLKVAARRELEEETTMQGIKLEQLESFGQPGRDPRGHVVSVVYLGVVDRRTHDVRANSDAKRVAWFDVDDLPPLAFDHTQILEMAIQRFRVKLRRPLQERSL